MCFRLVPGIALYSKGSSPGKRSTHWDTVFTSHTSVRGLISKPGKELEKYRAKNIFQWKIGYWCDRSEQNSKEIKVAKKYFKKFFTSLAIKNANSNSFEILSYNSPNGYDQLTNASKDVEKGEPSFIVDGISNWWSHSGNQCIEFLQS